MEERGTNGGSRETSEETCSVVKERYWLDPGVEKWSDFNMLQRQGAEVCRGMDN